MPGPDPDRRIANRLIWLISIATVIAMLAGWARYGKPVDAEQAWRERAGR